MIDQCSYAYNLSSTSCEIKLEKISGLNRFRKHDFCDTSAAIDPLHKWRLNLNNKNHTSLASHSCENSFVLKHECETKDV